MPKLLTAQSTYDWAIEKLMEDRHRVDSWKEDLAIVDKMVAEFRDKLEMMGSCGWRFGEISGALLIIRELEDIRDVIPVLKRLRELGYKCKQFEDYPEIRRRRYDLGNIQVLAMLTWKEGAACRFVEVGKEEKPVYKLMCDQNNESMEVE